MPARIPKALVALVVGLTVGVVALATFSRPPAPVSHARSGRVSADGARPVADRRARATPLAVLHEWDDRRAAAWAAGDRAALARLYTARSAAGHADVALLHRYAEHGLRVRGMQMQVLGARTLVLRPHLLELEVTDRLASAVAVQLDDPRIVRQLPSDRATTHLLVLRRVDGRWLVDRVSVVGSTRAGDPRGKHLGH